MVKKSISYKVEKSSNCDLWMVRRIVKELCGEYGKVSNYFVSTHSTQDEAGRICERLQRRYA